MNTTLKGTTYGDCRLCGRTGKLHEVEMTDLLEQTWTTFDVFEGKACRQCIDGVSDRLFAKLFQNMLRQVEAKIKERDDWQIPDEIKSLRKLVEERLPAPAPKPTTPVVLTPLPITRPTLEEQAKHAGKVLLNFARDVKATGHVNILQMIKCVRDLTPIGLKEAKEACEAALAASPHLQELSVIGGARIDRTT